MKFASFTKIELLNTLQDLNFMSTNNRRRTIANSVGILGYNTWRYYINDFGRSHFKGQIIIIYSDQYICWTVRQSILLVELNFWIIFRILLLNILQKCYTLLHDPLLCLTYYRARRCHYVLFLVTHGLIAWDYQSDYATTIFVKRTEVPTWDSS